MSESNLDLDLLTADFADLPVAASYRIPPSGAYRFKVTGKFGASKAGKPMVTTDYEVLEVINQADANEQAAVVGDKFSQYFMWGDERGMGDIQGFVAPFVKHFGVSRIGDLLVSEHNMNGLIKDVEVVCVLKRTPRRDKVTKAIVDGEYFVNTRDVQVV